MVIDDWLRSDVWHKVARPLVVITGVLTIILICIEVAILG